MHACPVTSAVRPIEDTLLLRRKGDIPGPSRDFSPRKCSFVSALRGFTLLRLRFLGVGSEGAGVLAGGLALRGKGGGGRWDGMGRDGIGGWDDEGRGAEGKERQGIARGVFWRVRIGGYCGVGGCDEIGLVSGYIG